MQEVMNLDELIASAVAEVERRREAERIKAEADALRYKALLDSVTSNAIERVTDQIPAALRPYVAYVGHQAAESDLRNYPEGWVPVEFAIAGAPGLISINFRLAWSNNTPQINLIYNSGRHYGADWTEAIADAHRLHQELAEAEAELI